MEMIQRMIDIHNHILIDVDDGPKNTEEAVELLKQSKQQGITDIIATPHHLNPKYETPNEVVIKKIQELSEIDEIKTLNIKIYPGQEIRLTDQLIPQLENGEAIGLNHSKYLLIELPSNDIPHYTKRLFYELQSRGYIPIIAHPERNKRIITNLDDLYDLINSGALSQLTSASLVGHYGKKIQKLSIQMIENNLTHFIASDAHHTKQRPFIMNELFDNKKIHKYEKNIQKLIENAQFVIQNKDIVKRRPTQDYRHKKFFGLF